MGKRTSIYLDDDLAAAVKASGETMADVLRRGAGLPGPAAVLERLAAEFADRVDVALGKLRAEIAEDVRAVLAEEIRDGVRSALRDAQGGSW